MAAGRRLLAFLQPRRARWVCSRDAPAAALKLISTQLLPAATELFGTPKAQCAVTSSFGLGEAQG